MNILILNGPNINMLGIRERAVYGEATYDDLVLYVRGAAAESEAVVEIYQSNHEGDLIDKIHEAYHRGFDGIIINPGALAHYSYALRDALAAVNIKTAEVHLSAVEKREPFRRVSVIKDVCAGYFSGYGFAGYKKAITFLMNGE